jgi:hypothetical protein
MRLAMNPASAPRTIQASKPISISFALRTRRLTA